MKTPSTDRRGFLSSLLAGVGVSALPQLAFADAPASFGSVAMSELALVRSHLARGLVVLSREPWAGAAARTTIYTRVQAPLARVRDTLQRAEQFRSMFPALDSVEVRARTATQTAARMNLSAAGIRVSVDVVVRSVGLRRVDFQILGGDLGPSTARWDLLEDGDGTIVVCRLWCDPLQGNWLVRQLANANSWVASSASVVAGTTFLLAVRQTAEGLDPRTAPAIVPQALAPQPEQLPRVDGTAWTSVLNDTAVMIAHLDEQLRVTATTSIGITPVPLENLRRRVEGVSAYHQHFSWLHSSSVQSPQPSVQRFQMRLDTPFAAHSGTMEMLRESPTSWNFRGLDGALARDSARWELRALEPDVSLAVHTQSPRTPHAGMLPNLVLERVRASAAGFEVYWNFLVMQAARANL